MLAGNGFGITGAASTVARDNLTSNVVLVSNGRGKIAASSLTVNSIQGIITGGATTIIDYNLTPNKAVISDVTGKVSTSSVSYIEVGYLVGVNDSIQNQFELKANQATTYNKTEVDTSLLLKANQATTYNKTEVDTSLLLKANQATTYTKPEVDNGLLLKANQSTTYTKTEVNDKLLLKANQATTYNKTEVNDKLLLKANQSTTYTRAFIDALLTEKADHGDVYERGVLYTKIETNNLLNTKQNNLITELTDDASTHQILNGTRVKILEEGTNINIVSHPTKLVINSTTDLSNYFTHTEVTNLLNTKQDEIGLLNDNTKIQLLNTSNVLKSLSAGSNIVLTNDATNNNFVNISANLSSYYTQTEVNSLLTNKQDSISSTGNFKVYEHIDGIYSSGVLSHSVGLLFAVSSTVPPAHTDVIMTMDASTGVAIANSLNVSNNLQVQGVGTFIGNVSAPNLYTKTEVGNLLNTKQGNIGLFNDNTKIQLLNTSNVLKSLSAGSNIVLTNDATGNNFVEISADLSPYYTQTEVNILLNNKQDSISSTGNFKVYEHNYGPYSAGVLSHTYGLQFAVSSSVPPATSQLIMTMDASTGVAIAHSLDISNNLQVNGVCTFVGNVSAPNIYNKTETNNLLSNYALIGDLLLKANSADVYTQLQVDNRLNAKQNSLTFHDDELNFQYPLLNGSTVRSLESGSDVVITSTATSLKIDVAPSLTVESFTVKSNSGDSVITLAANGENKDAILYLGTPWQGNLTGGMKAAIIAEGLTHYSRCKLHFCLNNQNNHNDTSLNESQMTIEPNGNVGIGTTTPSAKLHVQGSVTAVSFNSSSDTRIKTNQQQVPYDDCKHIFRNVEAKKYTRTDIAQQRVGFIAQDLDAVCTNEFACIVGRLKSADIPAEEVIDEAQPYTTPKDDEEGLLTVDYSRLVIVLWGVCKDLSTRLSELENNMNQKAKKTRT